MGRIGELLQEDIEIRAPAQRTRCRNRCVARYDSTTWCSTTRRPDQAALDHFNLHVRPGETVALVGPSGAGKSTVLSMLLRFHDPASGRIDVDGIDVRQVDPAELRAQLALPQQPTLFAASARDNIRYGARNGDAEVEDAARGRRCFPARVAAGL